MVPSVNNFLPMFFGMAHASKRYILNKVAKAISYSLQRARMNAMQTMRGDSRLARLLAIEGILYTIIITMCHNNNNLYASRLGATSSDLGLIASLPPLVGLACLIPFAIITDRMKNKRNMVIFSTLLLGSMYVVVGSIAFWASDAVWVLILMLVMVNFPMSLYNSSWQSFFSDVALPEERNNIYAHRTRMNTAVGIIFPLIFGGILTLASGNGKILIHQIYYFLALPLAFGQVILLKRVPYCGAIEVPKYSVKDLSRTTRALFSDRSFLGFLVVALLVYAGWQMDWSIYFQAQFYYLKLNEIQLSLIAVLCAVTQFIMLGTWSRLGAKKGVKFVFFIGAAGFAFCCVSMFFSLLMPLRIGVWTYFIFQSIGSSAFSAFQFSLLMCLLEVIPPINKTLSIALYSSLILVSNIIMPYLGVFIYNVLGENREAMTAAIGVVALLRIVAATMAFIRWYRHRHDPPFVLRYIEANSGPNDIVMFDQSDFEGVDEADNHSELQ